jgi:acetolactate synthase I/III small subunit
MQGGTADIPPLLSAYMSAAGAVFIYKRCFFGRFVKMRNVLSVFVQNQPGVLVRVASMFSRREFNIDSLSVGVTQSPEYSRITVVVHGDENLVDQMIKQLEKLPDVVAVQRLDAGAAVCRGMTMIKVKADDTIRLDVLKMAELFRAHVIDVQPTTLIFEITGEDAKVTAFLQLLSPYGILEVIRTGLIGLERGEHTIYEHCEEREYYGKNLL